MEKFMVGVMQKIQQVSIVSLTITRKVGQDGGHDKKLRNKMASDNAKISIGI
jgi:hypothetical protein